MIKDYCALAKPIHPSKDDKLTDGTVLQIDEQWTTFEINCPKNIKRK